MTTLKKDDLIKNNTGDWEDKLEDLAAINYNLYLAGTVRRADTGADWTHEQALSEIKTFITTLLAAEREAGAKEVIHELRDMFKDTHELGTNHLNSELDRLENK